MNKKIPIPTEEYPKVLWYQYKRYKYTPEEQEIVFTRYVISFYYHLTKNDKRDRDEINLQKEKLAKEKANNKINEDNKILTILKNVLVNDRKEHKVVKEEIENHKDFIQWYEV